jgi:hypothetical protein
MPDWEENAISMPPSHPQRANERARIANSAGNVRPGEEVGSEGMKEGKGYKLEQGMCVTKRKR